MCMISMSLFFVFLSKAGPKMSCEGDICFLHGDWQHDRLLYHEDLGCARFPHAEAHVEP